ncbi:MAG: TonB-dependent receptor [Acidobacteriota bacterium]
MAPPWIHWLAALLAAGTLAQPASASQSLADALEALRSDGIETLYTHRLVTDDQRVDTVPAAGSPERRLRDLLTPFGLRARPSDGGPWVVTRIPVGTVEGCLRADPGGQPVSGAEIAVGEQRVEPASSDPAGCFRLLGVPAGERTVRISRPGYLPKRIDLRVEPGGVHPVSARLAIDAEVRESVFVSVASEAPPLGSTRLRPERIESAARADGDVLSALADLPGAVPGSGVAVTVRGQGADRIALVLDGMDVVEPYHLRDLGTPAGVVTPSAVAEMTLHRGRPPVAYGNRGGPVLEMVTAQPRGRASGKVGLGVESFQGTVGLSLFGGRGRWLGAYREGDPLLPRELGEFDTQPSYLDGYTKLAAALGPSRDLVAQNLWADDVFYSEQLDQEDAQYLVAGQESRHTGLRVLSTLGPRHLVEATVSESYVFRVRGTFEIDGRHLVEREELRTYLVNDRRRTRRRGARVEVQSRLGDRLDLRWGVEAGADRTHYLYRDFDPTIIDRSGETDTELKLRGGRLGAFALGSWRPRADLTVTAGTRWDDDDLSGGSRWAPRLGVSLRRGRSIWRVHWARAVATPTSSELRLADDIDTLPGVEARDHLTVGFLHGSSRRTVAVELYSQRVDDPRLRIFNLYKPISRIPEQELDRLQLDAEATRIDGLEIRLDHRGRRLETGFAYQLGRAEDRLGGAWSPRQGDRRHAAFAHLALRLPWSLRLAARWSGATGAPFTPFDVERFRAEGFAAALGGYHSRRLEPTHRLDLRLTWSGTIRGLHPVIEVGVDNVYDRRRVRGFDLSGLGNGQTTELRPELGFGRELRWGVELRF